MSVIDLLSAEFPKAKGLVIKQVDSSSVEKKWLRCRFTTQCVYHLPMYIWCDISIKTFKCAMTFQYTAFIDILMLTWSLLKNNVLSHLFNKV